MKATTRWASTSESLPPRINSFIIIAAGFVPVNGRISVNKFLVSTHKNSQSSRTLCSCWLYFYLLEFIVFFNTFPNSLQAFQAHSGYQLNSIRGCRIYQWFLIKRRPTDYFFQFSQYGNSLLNYARNAKITKLFSLLGLFRKKKKN